jgi:hypothetical protein
MAWPRSRPIVAIAAQAFGEKAVWFGSDLGLALAAPGVYCTDIQYGARPWTFVRVLQV